MNKLLILLLIPVTAFAMSEQPNKYNIVNCSITFTYPTQRADNSPLLFSEISHYNVYFDGVQRPIPIYMIKPETMKVSWPVKGGICPCIRLTAVDTKDQESNLSHAHNKECL